MKPLVKQCYVLVLAFLMCDHGEVQATVSCLPSVQFACNDGFQCLPSTWQCDGVVECKDFSDEENCGPKTCGSNEFQCASSGVCIPISWKCNGEQDCADNSDEDRVSTCPDITPEPYQCPPNQWLCVNEATPQCIHGTKVCDGTVDCLVGNSDEHYICALSNLVILDMRMCSNRTCDYCVNTETGGFCWCPDGYKVNNNTDKCEDIKECEEDACEQQCMELEGSYNCSCSEGFTKDADGHCKASGDRTLVYSNLASVQAATVHEASVNVTTLRDVDGVVVMDIDVRRNKMCFISYGARDHSLNCSALDGTSSTAIKLDIDLKSINNFAIDWVSGNFYFADFSGPNCCM